jgi:hypothetical protein
MPLTRSITTASLALLAGCALAHAAPISWVSIPGPINSRGLYGSPTNVVTTTPAMPTIGPFYYLTVSGNLNKVAPATRASEACIEVTMPSGAKFVIKPFTTGAFSGTIAVPADAACSPQYFSFGAGTCGLRFFELYADNASGPDATWTNLQITLHDGAGNDSMPFSTTIVPTAENPNTNNSADFVGNGVNTTGSYAFSQDRIVTRARYKGFGTAMCGSNVNSTSSPLKFVQYTITAPRADGGGNASWVVAPFADDAASTTQFDTVIDTPVPVLCGPSSPWSYSATAVNSPTNDFTTVAVVRFGLQPQVPDAPAASDMGVIRSIPAIGSPVATPVIIGAAPATPGAIKWYKFTTEQPCTPAGLYWFDIHTQIPQGSAITDHEIAVFNSAGVLEGQDDDDGSDHRSLLTFGQSFPVRPPVMAAGSPAPRDGHDGTLPAGEHYLAVAQYNASFGPFAWVASTTGASSGTIGFEIRTNLPPAACGPADIGSQGGAVGSDGVLDNNDFVVFIDRFFAQSPTADRGMTGGVAGSDGHWDNNDFVVFIDQFFTGCI